MAVNEEELALLEDMATLYTSIQTMADMLIEHAKAMNNFIPRVEGLLEANGHSAADNMRPKVQALLDELEAMSPTAPISVPTQAPTFDAELNAEPDGMVMFDTEVMTDSDSDLDFDIDATTILDPETDPGLNTEPMTDMELLQAEQLELLAEQADAPMPKSIEVDIHTINASDVTTEQASFFPLVDADQSDQPSPLG